VSAIDCKTGKTLWNYDPKACFENAPPNVGFISRGLSYWAKGEDRRILVGTGDGYLIALNAKTGRIARYRQIEHHGLWECDLPTAPNLMDLTVNGKTVKALAQVTKQGFVFTFDRSTGQPEWPVTEKPVPQSSVPGERSSLTQPFPSLPAPFVQQGVSEDDLIDLTPQLKEEAKKILSRYNYGPLYFPPTTDKAGTLQVPGVLGGASWAGAAHNPKTNVLYVPSFTIPFGIKLKKENEGAYDYTGTRAGVGGPQGLALFNPPFSTITAIDMNTGKHLWRVPAGKGPVDHPALEDLKLDRVGVPRESFIALTDNVLFLAPEGTNSVLGLSSRGNALITQATADEKEPFLHAHDARTSDVLCEVKLPGAALGALMAYRAGGRQYVVVPIGGADRWRRSAGRTGGCPGRLRPPTSGRVARPRGTAIELTATPGTDPRICGDSSSQCS
jgi:quinoprotein glucose dehydrogenase